MSWKRTHGLSAIPEMGIYWAMMSRCNRSADRNFHHYGGRGITVCERWMTDPAKFILDMGPRPSLKHSLERRDNDSGYSPNNCYWATWIEQHSNTRHNHKITFNGETRTVTAWARHIGISASGLFNRLRRGWAPKKALSEGARW